MEHRLAVHHVCVMEAEQEASATAGEKLIERLRSDCFLCLWFGKDVYFDTLTDLTHNCQIQNVWLCLLDK